MPTLQSSALLLTLAALSLPTDVVAQDAATQKPATRPAAAEKFKAMLGSWEGNGNAYTPGVPGSQKWTATSEVRAILGNQWVQEDMQIDFGADAPAPLVFRSYYGFDRQTGRWTQFSFSNAGVAQAHVLHWVDDAVVYGSTTEEDGKLVIERWRSAWKENSFLVVGYRAEDNGKPALHVRGAFQRTKAPAVTASLRKAATLSFAPPAAEMSFLDRWAGTYRLQATMTQEPGTQPIAITATDRIQKLFGGVASVAELKGDPVPGMGTYEGRGIMMWSALENCYRSLWIDNMGEVAFDKGQRHAGKIIFGGQSIASGVVTSYHNVIATAADGSLQSVTEHRIQGDRAPYRSFAGSYTRVKR